MTMERNPLDTFKYFIDHQMKMMAIYQPVLIRTLLQTGGTSHRSLIAKEIEIEDSGRMGGQEAYENIVMKLPGQVLEDRGWVVSNESKSEYTLTVDLTGTTEDNVNALVRSCELRIKSYQSQRATGSDGRRKYFSVFVDPRVYQIEDAMASLDQDWWATKGRSFEVGDRVLFWMRGEKDDGFDRSRGIVGFGEIVSPPKITDDLRNPYWVDPAGGSTTEERVLVRYLSPNNGPLWVQDYGIRLYRLALSVAGYPFVLPTPNGTLFSVSEGEWEQIIDLAEGWPDTPSEHRSEDPNVDTQGDLDTDIDSTATRTMSLTFGNPPPNDDPNEWGSYARRIRKGQSQFRQKLLDAYGHRCAVTDYGPDNVLEAAHIEPHAKSGINQIDNGLLLRSDIHDLFDDNLIGINPDTYTLALKPKLLNSQYKVLDGQSIRPTIDGSYPSCLYLRQRWQEFSNQ
jgi:hypothetical protein